MGDEELQIVVSSVLEADEQASARRIASQLPEISRRVNEQSTIRILTEIDESNIRQTQQQISRSLSNAASVPVGVTVDMDMSAIDRFRNVLSDLHVDDNITRAISAEMDSLGIRIDKISGAWEKVNDGKQRFLNLTIQGTDQDLRQVTIAKQFGEETEKANSKLEERSSTITRITSNLEQQRRVQEQSARQAERENDQRQAGLTKLMSSLEQVQRAYQGLTGTKGVQDAGRLKELNEFYDSIRDRINALSRETGQFTATQREEVRYLIDTLKRLAKEYYTVEHSATTLRTKTVDVVGAEQLNKLTAFENKLRSSGMLTEDFASKISSLREKLNGSLDSTKIREFLDGFGKLRTEAAALEQQLTLDRKIDAINLSMQSIPATIESLNARFRQLTDPTDTLVNRMNQLASLSASVTGETNENRKIEAYRRLAEMIELCSAEITNLNRVQNIGVRDVRLSEGIEKLRADIETTGRTWSAFKANITLNDEFTRISQQAQRIATWPEMQKLTAQFNSFKSEVKAAGLNVMSLADTFKNNLGKVLQWVSATTLLFRAIRLLRNALSTVTALNTAMVDLRKVTVATNAEYREFYRTANETARQLNATTEAVISQTAEWARLGYSMRDAAELAKNAMIFAAVSPGMEQTQATDGLVSIIKAYGIEVDDTLDGVISKVNEVGNKFAVSNKDIVEALTRSSSAMAAANNTFEETVALATAAIEITRDAATVGNGLKTLSMRIRGYDEETEAFSEDVAILTGKIADLTKTASKPGGISLFEKNDPETYRSTYDILKDISEIWDELTDRNRATLLDALFGKRQAQIGSAILSNFSQAEDAIRKMESSAGSAEREMAKVADSVQYRLNALKETWTGVAQSLFEADDMKAVLAFFQSLSDVVAHLTDTLGLFGTVGVVGAVLSFSELRKSIAAVHASITPVMEALRGVSFYGTSADTLRFVDSLNSLDTAQQRVTLSAMGYTRAQQDQIMATAASIGTLSQLTVKELEEKLQMDAGRISTLLHVQATDQLTKAQLRQLISSAQLTNEERRRIAMLLGETAATNGARLATDAYNLSLKESIALMLSTPMGWVSLLLMLIPLLIQAGKYFNDLWEAAHPPLSQLETEYQELTDEVDKLSGELNDAKKRLGELQELADAGTISVVEEQELERLKTENDYLSIQLETYKQLAEAKKASIAVKAAEDAQKFLSDTGYREYHGGDERRATGTGAGGLAQAIKAYQDAKNAYHEELDKGENASVKILNSYTKAQADSLEQIKTFQDTIINLRSDLMYDPDKNAEQIRELEKLLAQIDLATGGTTTMRRLWNEQFGEDVDVSTEKVEAFNGQLRELGLITEDLSRDRIATMFDETKVAAEESKRGISSLTEGFEDLGDALEAIRAHGGTADLLNRPVVDVTESNIGKVQGLGLTDAKVGDHMTVASKTYQAGTTALVVTPILPNGEILSQKELDKYMKSLIASGKKNGNYSDFDAKGILLGAFGDKTTFDANNKMAEEFAVRLHEIHEEMLGVNDADGMRALIAELYELTEYDPSIAALADKFADLEDKVKKLSTGMKEFSEDGAISLKTLSDIGETFGDFDSFEAFAKTLTDSGSTMEQVQQAANDLASEFVNSAQILDMLRDGNEELVRSMLEDIGVTNAAEVVEARLSALRLVDRLSAMGLADATWEVAKQKLQEAGATETAIAALEAYRKKQVEARIATTDFVTANASTIASYLQLAKAAGIAGKSIDILTQMQALEAGASEGMKKTYQYGAAMTRYKDQLQSALTDDIEISLPEVKVSVPQLKSGSSSAKKETDKYIAEIDRFREAVKRLEDTQEEAAALEGRLGREEDLRRQIELQSKLIDVYGKEQGALHDLNEERRKAIAEGVDKLTKLGFEVEYDQKSNELFIKNLEHLNELATTDLTKYETMADMSTNIVGKYSNATDATNGLIKDTEGIIENITEFNEANKEGSSSWWDLKDGIHSAKQAIIDDLKQIAENAHDAVDEIQNVYDTLHAAADEYAANDGYLTIDTYQSIRKLGAQYMQYLRDENGLLVINEENIQKVIAARTEQLALEEALTYVERLRQALEADSIEDLNNLLYTTTDATNATWGLVYANLALLDLTDDQYEAALHNINAIRDLADAAIQGIGKESGAFSESLQNMKDGLDDILKYVMDMLKQRVNDQIQAIEDMKDAYGEVIDQRKEALRLAKEESGYQKTMAQRMKELAKLRARYDALSLDDSRASQAERASIAEEMAKLQDEINEAQADRMVDKTEDALDEMQKAYESEKDAEIKELQDSISSTEKLYRMAMDYLENEIGGDYEKLKNQLIDWNYEVGNSLQSEIEEAVDNAIAALERFGGSYQDAISGVKAEIESASGDSGINLTVGQSGMRAGEERAEEAGAGIVQQMKANSDAWHSASAERRVELENENDRLHRRLEGIVGGDIERINGTWYWNGKPLYPQFGIYHNGGVVGGGSAKEDEQLALLKKHEWVLDEAMTDNLSEQIERIGRLQGAIGALPAYVRDMGFANAPKTSEYANSVTNNNRPVSIVFGDTNITGADSKTIQQHVVLTESMKKEIARWLGFRM